MALLEEEEKGRKKERMNEWKRQCPWRLKQISASVLLR
jgi:hypothetical protein